MLLLVDCLKSGHPVLSRVDPPHPWESLSVLGTLDPTLRRLKSPRRRGHETFLAGLPCRVPPPLLATLWFLCPPFVIGAVPPVLSPHWGGNRPQRGPVLLGETLYLKSLGPRGAGRAQSHCGWHLCHRTYCSPGGEFLSDIS